MFWMCVLFGGIIGIFAIYWICFGEDSPLFRFWKKIPRKVKLPSLKKRVSTLEDRLSELHKRLEETRGALYDFIKECNTSEQLKHLHGAYRKLQSEAIAMGKELNDLKTEKADRFTNLEVD